MRNVRFICSFCVVNVKNLIKEELFLSVVNADTGNLSDLHCSFPITPPPFNKNTSQDSATMDMDIKFVKLTNMAKYKDHRLWMLHY